MADQDIFISDVRAEFNASGAQDRQLEFIEGADHFMRPVDARSRFGHPRPRLMRLLCDWTRQRFAQ